MFDVREATAADADVLAALNAAFNGVPRSGEQIRAQMRTPGRTETTLLADEFGATCGFLCYQVLRSVCYGAPWVELTELYVAPEHRGRGAGRALLEEARRRAAEAGASEVLFRTNAANRDARRLFARVGFQVAPHIVYRSTPGGAGRAGA